MPATSAGDPARTLALLWRDPAVISHRGPRRSLSLDTVVAAATAIARDRGLAAVTMREVARVLGVVPMTLYTYVPSKAELLDLMLDTAYAAMPRTGTTGQSWRNRLTTIADENRELFDAHPWAIAVSTRRPPLGPGSIAKYEYELSALVGLGLTDVDVDDCLTLLLDFVQANAGAASNARTIHQLTAMTDQQWWKAAGPVLARYLDPSRFPLATRVGTAAGQAHGGAYDPDHAYRFGLQRVLDGLATLIEHDGPRSASLGESSPPVTAGTPHPDRSTVRETNGATRLD